MDTVVEAIVTSLKEAGCKNHVFDDEFIPRAVVKKGREKALLEMAVDRRSPSKMQVRISRDDTLQSALMGERQLAYDKTARKRKGNENRSMYSYIWLFYILGAVLALFAMYISVLSEWVGAEVLASVVALVGAGFIMFRVLKARQRGPMPTAFEHMVFETALYAVQQLLQSEAIKKKCWNCFTEIPSESDFCPKCGNRI